MAIDRDAARSIRIHLFGLQECPSAPLVAALTASLATTRLMLAWA